MSKITSWLANLTGTSKKHTSILIAEDDLFLRPILRAILREIDPAINVRWATSVAEARAEIEREMPTLILADCVFGAGESGMRLWNYCRATCPKVPFAMISGMSPGALAQLAKAERLPVPELIQKPFLSPRFKARVSSLLGVH